MPEVPVPVRQANAKTGLNLEFVASYPNMRVLAWNGEILYASRGYHLLRAAMSSSKPEWQPVAEYNPSLWRELTSAWRLSSRLFRDGFHALAVLSTGHLLAAAPGVIVRLFPGESEFQVSHKIIRGTRPLHIAVSSGDCAYWGEYYDNRERNEVHVYASEDRGLTWNVAYTFPRGAVRHIHNIVYDVWQRCLWVLTGDDGAECRILRTSLDFREVETVLSGNQQARAVAILPSEEGLYFSSDTPLEQNYVYHLDRRGHLNQLAPLSSSSIYGCQVGSAKFFSTMIEPSAMNRERAVCVYGSVDLSNWSRQLEWKKDRWPMHFFQYGNAMLPDGVNSTDLLAVSTIAVESADLQTSIWRVIASSEHPSLP